TSRLVNFAFERKGSGVLPFRKLSELRNDTVGRQKGEIQLIIREEKIMCFACVLGMGGMKDGIEWFFPSVMTYQDIERTKPFRLGIFRL
uniref:hypothetical protein n=1 Tax=Aeromonas sp. Ne-1 TaxID=1675689 RepID=UPI001F30BFFB